jgi:lysozyme family protein
MMHSREVIDELMGRVRSEGLSLYEAAMVLVLSIEGGYVDDPNDLGGKTNWGVTERLARAYGYEGSMRKLTKKRALAIGKDAFWFPLKLDVISERYGLALAAEMLDSGYNMGTHWPALWLQEWLNAFNNQGMHYADIEEDGKIGSGTLAALADFKNIRGFEGIAVLVDALNASQAERYKYISRRRSKNERFTYGWMLHRVHK